MLEIRTFISKLSNYKKLICLILVLSLISVISFNNKSQKEILIYNDSIKINDFQKVQNTKKNKLKLLVKEQVNLIASININTESWNTLDDVLETVSYKSDIIFTIEDTDDLNPIEEKYYYISSSASSLNPEQITEWQIYGEEVEITTEGFYVIYAKVIDASDNVSYLNTDLLILDKTSPTASIDEWSDLRSELNRLYIDKEKLLKVEATDLLSGILSIQYYISDDILNTTELSAIANWLTYSEEIIIDEIGSHIVYVKVTDNAGNVTYINTDYIILNGYTVTDLFIGRNKTSYESIDPYITDKSLITLKISYSSASEEISDYNHNLISNILLEVDTKINLIDYVSEKVYEYIVPTTDDIYGYNDSCDIEDLECVKVATYPISLFKEVGTDDLFIEKNYYNNGTITEDFAVIVDLANTNNGSNQTNVSLYMELHDSLGKNIRPTLNETIKNFNIYSVVNDASTESSLSLTTDYSGNLIKFNSSSVTDINITSAINYKYLNEYKIVDSTYEDKEVGLSIKLVDSEGAIVDKKHLKNIIFKVGNNIYRPESDNIIHINLNNGINDITKTLSIITGDNDSNLDEGTYYFKISNFASYDGYYYDELNNIELSIPVEVKNPIVYSFDVMVDDEYRILKREEETINIPFNLLQNGNLEKPNIRVSLYKKNELTAFNQDYSLVDLSIYISNILDGYGNNVYSVSTDPIDYIEPDYLFNNFELNLIMNNFENFGYKFVFELYDDNERIGTIEKYFIVKEE